ncbi:J domain-containing protein [Sphingomonas sp. S2-65]|uniref:J domain-containing protein n=1 Tax=Sphingomonas sp. S2-65 TaxID=2903960 RepID=UPI0021BC4F79|nr:DnaJ domain-containing protein [Sphingomonas sp. S2-65]UYY59869.1 DnaJ domain-containing protein [Sphingomonas sp. S2-65]
MASSSDYYAVLGVSPMSDEVVIRAAFKALMLKYHPDTNKNADATQRAAAINEAFGVLGDSQRRAAYDASRAQGARSSAPPPPPPPPPSSPPPSPSEEPARPQTVVAAPHQISWLARLGGIAAVALVIGVVKVGLREATRPSSSTPAYASASDSMAVTGMDTMTDNMVAVDQATSASEPGLDIMMANMASDTTSQSSLINATTAFTYQAPTNIDFKVIEGAAGAFAKVLNRGGIIGARAWSQNCHDDAEKTPSWTAADRCAAFDYAARYIDAGMVKAADIRPNAYFAFQAENQADSYKIVGGQPYTVGERLRRIQNAVEPVTYEAVIAGIQQREARRAREKPADEQASEAATDNTTND